MSYSLTRKTYTTSTAKGSSPVDDHKKKSSLLKDNSWIRRDPEEDEPVDRDPNPGRAILSRYRSNETLASSELMEPQSPKSPKTISSSSSSVHSLTKRFSASQDELSKTGSLPNYGRTTMYNARSTSSLRSTDEPKITKTTIATKDGKTTETTTITQSVVKTPTKTETFTERVFSDVKSPSKGITNTLPARPKVSETTEVKVTTSKVPEDELFDTLIPTSIKTGIESPKTVSKTETVTVKSSPYGDTTKTTTRTSSTTEDQLFDTLLPSGIKSKYSSPDSSTTTITTKREIVTVDSPKGDNTKTVIVTSPTSPTKTTTRTEDQLFDTLLPSGIKSKYSSPDSSTTTITTKREIVTVDSPKGDNTKTVIVTSPTSPTKTTTRTEDQLFDTLLPSGIKSKYSSPDSSTTTITTKREIVTVDSPKGDNTKTVTVTSPTSPTKTTTRTEDQLFDTLLPSAIRSGYSSPDSDNTKTVTITSPTSPTKTTSYSISSKPSEDYTRTSIRRNYSSKPDSNYEYSSVTSPTVHSPASYKDSLAHDLLSDSFTSKSTKNVYSPPERTVLEKDLCTYCRKPMSSDPKMVLEDMNINCHTTCFKCVACSSSLGNLKAGDSLWIYRRSVHCEKCFEATREKWRR